MVRMVEDSCNFGKRISEIRTFGSLRAFRSLISSGWLGWFRSLRSLGWFGWHSREERRVKN